MRILEKDFLVKHRLLEFRARVGWPQWKVGLAVGMSPSQLSLLEQGHPPKPGEIEKLSRFFEVPADEIWPGLEMKEKSVSHGRLAED